MEPYTLSRTFLKRDIIDNFLSIIWTERYYGDSEVELVVPASYDMINKLQVGVFLGIDDSDEIMIIESMDISDGKIKLTGIALLPWFNNRFIRTTSNHEDRYWYLSDSPPGFTLWTILYYMCHSDSPYLVPGSNIIGIPNPEFLAIPGLTVLDIDMSGDNIKVAVPYGPVYDAMKEIAITYQIGMQIKLDYSDEEIYYIGFRAYRGIDRTSYQNINPIIQFSPEMDSFTNIKELQSIAALKTNVYAFAPGLKSAEGDPPLTTLAGVSALSGVQYTEFDLRALMIFADDLTTDQVGSSQDNVIDILNSRAHDALTTNHFVKAVDGEIVPESQFKYGVDYDLGDIIEVQGNSGIVQTARITEYIRSQDASGEKAYPTVSMIG